MNKIDLYDLSFREFSNKTEGFFNNFKETCERERMWVTMLLQPHSKKTLRPDKLIKFEWEKKVVNIDKKKSEESLARIKKRDKIK